MKKYIFIVFVLWLSVSTYAQGGRSLYFMEQVPFSNTVNPAFHPEHKFYINLPVFSIYQNVELPFALNKLLTKIPDEDSLMINFDYLKHSLDEQNTFAFNNVIELVKVGFKIKNHYFHLGINQRLDVSMDLDKDLILLFLAGNGSPELLGKEVDIAKSGFNANLYHEAYLGYNITLFEKLTLGVRAKYLRGVGNISTKKFNVNFKTDDSTYFIHLSSDIEIQQTTDISQFTQGTSLVNMGNNSGYAFDFGLNMDINDKLRVNMSVMDIGSIYWNENAHVSRSINPNHEFVFKGLSFTDSTAVKPNAILDSIKNSFAMTTEDKSYISYLLPKVYLGASYSIFGSGQLGFLYRTDIANTKDILQNPYSLTLNYKHVLFNMLSLQANYSIINNTYNNIGAGASFKLGPIIIYAMTDNVMGIVDPSAYKNYSAIVGMSFLIGKVENDEH
jgi:hypothetical protein